MNFSSGLNPSVVVTRFVLSFRGGTSFTSTVRVALSSAATVPSSSTRAFFTAPSSTSFMKAP